MEKLIKKIFKENNLSYDWEISTELPNVVFITIEMGDWKHDHEALKYIMSKNSFSLVKVKVTDESDCDAYSAIYAFILN